MTHFFNISTFDVCILKYHLHSFKSNISVINWYWYWNFESNKVCANYTALYDRHWSKIVNTERKKKTDYKMIYVPMEMDELCMAESSENT